MEKFSFSVNLINLIFGYLGTRPYQEVFQLIEKMHQEIKTQSEDKNGGKMDTESNQKAWRSS